MSSERPEQFSDSSVSRGPQPAGEGQSSNDAADPRSSRDAASHEAIVVVRGEAVRDQESKSAPESPSKGKDKPRKEVSEAKLKLQNRLPALDDDADVGVQKDHVVTRDGKADLAFTGALIASAASPSAPKGEWKEYRIYETNGGKHVFSKITRKVFVGEQDVHEAEVFDPSPSSVSSQLLRGARDLTRSRPLTWTDAAVAFFGYDPLAKTLYRKVGPQFEEHIG